MERLEKLMIKKIQLLNKARDIDVKTKSEKAFNNQHAANNKKLADLSAQIKEEIKRQKQVLESIETINENIDYTVKYYGTASAAFRTEESAISTRGIGNKEIAKHVLLKMQTDLTDMISFHEMIGAHHESDSKKLEQVNQKISEL